jgi:glycosyltransferase involved in cell wall biosynthesis
VNILQISSASSIGGGERHLIDLTEGLIRRGHRLTVAVRRESPLIAKLEQIGSVQVRMVGLRNALDLASALALRRLVREHSIDIVHAHLARDYPLAAFAVSGSPRAQLVLTRHVLFPLGRFSGIIFGRAARVIAVSEAVRSRLVAQRIIDTGKIRLVANGIRLERFTVPSENAASLIREQLQLGSNTVLVGSVGSLVPLKGHDDLVGAAAMVVMAHPEVHFVIVGDEPPGDKSTLDRLRALIDRLGLNGRIHIVRRVPDVAPWLHAFDLFVSASHSESFGLAIGEAMAAGRAVVATETAGASEILSDGETGRLVPVGDVPALANAINELLANDVLRKTLGTAAAQAAKECFDMERMVDETEAVYREAAGGR